MSLLAARPPRSSEGRAADFESAARGFDPHRGDQFRVSLSGLEFVLSRPVPVRGFTCRTYFRLPLCALARLPFVVAAIALIPAFLDCNHCHNAKHISDNNILSRYILRLTDIYLSSNIFLR